MRGGPRFRFATAGVGKNTHCLRPWFPPLQKTQGTGHPLHNSTSDLKGWATRPGKQDAPGLMGYDTWNGHHR